MKRVSVLQNTDRYSMREVKNAMQLTEHTGSRLQTRTRCLWSGSCHLWLPRIVSSHTGFCQWGRGRRTLHPSFQVSVLSLWHSACLRAALASLARSLASTTEVHVPSTGNDVRLGRKSLQRPWHAFTIYIIRIRNRIEQNFYCLPGICFGILVQCAK